MLDFKLNDDGDLDISDSGEISLTESVRQNIKVRLKWIYNEWRLGPSLGFPWFEQVFVKNPNVIKIRSLLRNEILKIDEVTAAKVTSYKYSPATRKAVFTYTVTIGQETFEEEVELDG